MDTDYSNALAEDGRDLVDAARDGELPPADFRDGLTKQVLELLERKKSVLLVGPDGVGKTAVIHGVAQEMTRVGGDLIELSSTAMMSGTKYLGEWQSKVTAIAKRATDHQTILYFSDVWNLPKTGRTAQSDSNLLDALRPHITGKGLTLLAEASPETLRIMERNPGFVSLFTKVNVGPLGGDEVKACLDRAAERAGMELDADCRRTLIQLTTRFLPARPQPGPALDLLEQARDYQAEKIATGEHEAFGPALIERVFSVYSGLPLFVVSRSATMPAKEIRAWFEERIVGQKEALEAVVEAIALFKAGLHDPDKPIGTFLFVGPTGVGKTEVARALARFLYGSESRLLRFDLSEFKDFHSFEILVGNPKDPGRPASLVDPVRAQPFQVVLLDELEKAHSNVWDLLLSVLDEGRMTPPGGKTVDFRSTILIATSNVGAQSSDKRFGFTPDTGLSARRHSITKALETQFRPEFLNRFQHVTVFHPLSKDQVKQVARWELRRILAREGIAGRNLVVEVTDDALDRVIETGFEPKYGARALKREIQRQLVLPLAMTMMERNVEPGSIVKILAKDGHIRVRVLETEKIRERRAEAAPVKAEGQKLTRAALGRRLNAASEDIDALAAALDEDAIQESRARLDERRGHSDFWSKPDVAARVLRDLEQLTGVLDRMERLRGWNESLKKESVGSSRALLERLAHDLLRHERSIARARRELLVMGFDGAWDALVEIRPIGAGARGARDLVLDQLLTWAGSRKMEVDWLREPMRSDEPAMLAIKGRYAAGFLRLEAGLHRVKNGRDTGVCRVRVAPWSDVQGEVNFGDHKALKGKKGQKGGRIRSRVECNGLVLQNARNLSENRELAAEVTPSWDSAPDPSDAVVRRYDLKKPIVKDSTGWSSGKMLGPQAFQDLLNHRVDSEQV